MAVSGPKSSGGGGGAIVEVGSPGSPQVVTSNITVSADVRARIFVKGGSGGTVAPTIDDGIPGQEIFLFGTSDSDYLELQSGANIEVEDALQLRNKVQGHLQWSEARGKWQEVGRNNA